MATILYIALKLARIINSDDDWVNICHLLAMDTISFVLLMHWWRGRKA